MAEKVDLEDIETDQVFAITFGYEDYYLNIEAATKLRDDLNDFLRK